MIYYRLKTILKNGKVSYSNIIAVRNNTKETADVQILPNPVKDQLQILINGKTPSTIEIYVMDGNGKTIKKYKERVVPGSNTFTYADAGNFPEGVYYLLVFMDEMVIKRKFSVLK